MKDIPNTKNFRQTYQIQGRQRLEEIPHIKELNNGAANRSIRTCRTFALERCWDVFG